MKNIKIFWQSPPFSTLLHNNLGPYNACWSKQHQLIQINVIWKFTLLINYILSFIYINYYLKIYGIVINIIIKQTLHIIMY